MKKLLKSGLAAFAVMAFAAVVYAQTTGGFWGNWPIVGSASYSCGSVNNVSNCTVPAGPTVVTGLETVPANTGASGGQNPQNVLLSLASLNALPYSYQLVVTGSAFYTYTVPNTVGNVVFDIASGPISDERVTAPAAPIDGQVVRVNSRVTITALQFIANTGQTLAATTPTVLTASTTAPQGYAWLYRLTDKKWYRIQ